MQNNFKSNLSQDANQNKKFAQDQQKNNQKEQAELKNQGNQQQKAGFEQSNFDKNQQQNQGFNNQNKDFNQDNNQQQQEQQQQGSSAEQIKEIEKRLLPEYHFDPNNLPEIPEGEISADPDKAIQQLDKINEEQNFRIH